MWACAPAVIMCQQGSGWQVERQAPTLKFTPAGDVRVAASPKTHVFVGVRAAQRARHEVAETPGDLGNLLASLLDGFDANEVPA